MVRDRRKKPQIARIARIASEDPERIERMRIEWYGKRRDSLSRRLKNLLEIKIQ